MILRSDRLGTSSGNLVEVRSRVAGCTVRANVALVRVAVAVSAALAEYGKGKIQFRGCSLSPIGDGQSTIPGRSRLVAE
jgi:hypothetical protein